MAYYGSGGGAPPPPQYSQGSAPPQGLGPMFAGPPGHGQHEMYGQQPGMYQGGGTPQGYDGYDGHMYPSYGGQEYYNQQAPMHDYPNHGQGNPGMGQMEGGLYPRPHINPSFLPPENPPAQEKPTRILRNPYPTVSKEELRNQQKDEIYDPSNPTLSAAANSKNNANDGSRNGGSSSSMGYQRQAQLQNQNLQSTFHQQMQMAQNSQSQAPPQPQFHQSTSSMAPHSQGSAPPHFHQSGSSMAPHSQGSAPPHFHQSGSSMAPHSHAPPPPQFHQSTSSMAPHSQGSAPPHFHQSGSSLASHSQAPAPPQFHQSGPSVIPQSQHVATASVHMFDNMSAQNFASQAQQMSRLVSEAPRQEHQDSNGKMQVMTGLVTHVSPGAFGMISDEIFFQESCVSGPVPKVGDKVVVECEPVKGMPFKYNAKKVTKLDADLVRNDNAPSRSTPTAANNIERRYERPDFGPLPTMPESLNLPKACPPPNLSSMIPSSSQSSQPLKSILKRNPPPPPVISKAGVLDNLKPKPPSASSFKPGIFVADLDRDVPRMFGPSSAGPPLDFPEYTYVRDNDLRGQADLIRQTSPRITRLLPSSPTPIRERDFGRQQTFSPERERRNNVVSPTLNDIFERRDRSPTWRNRSKSPSKSPQRDIIRRRSSSPVRRKSRRSSSKSKSPRDRRSRRSRSKSSSPKRQKHPSPKSGRVARSPRRRSRSASPRNRRRSRSGSLRSRRRSRSISPRSRRRVSRSPSRDRRRSTSRSRRPHRSRKSSRSKSKSPSRRRRSLSSVRSASPTPSSFRRGGTIVSQTVTHGIVVKTGTSSLFPKVVDRGNGTLILSASGTSTTTSITTSKPAPMPIKFQIANPPKPQAIAPNPSLFTSGQQSGNYVQNPVFNITKTVANPSATQGIADMKGQKKKPREQEPAFRVIEVDPKVPEKPPNKVGNKVAADDKIKQWEAERQALKSKVTELTSDNLLKNPVKIHQLKQTIQNDLHELRSKEKKADPGVKLLENPKNIQQLRQTVERDLGELRNKEKPSSDKTETSKSQLNIQQLKSSVQQGLKELRSKFDSQAPKPPSQSNESLPGPSSNSKPIGATSSDNKPPASKGTGNGANIPIRTVRNSSELPKNLKKSAPLTTKAETPPYDEEMETLQEEIHRQRFLEEERRLREMGEQGALQQLYYMEDRRQRRLEERNLARIRMKEIQLKKDKKFGDLQKLREQYGPPAERLNHERQLRQARMDEETQESQLHGQAEAIRRQEIEYQKWLEDEANSRREAERASRGFEGKFYDEHS
ncbi:unnamed protein product [Orchesella dallaii]|uniref:S1-like RNA binding domain-containing protein n=1 Tax=Orchesella dallaii TaxID=48710 RepID=A0ABP1PQ32_9HEXA